MPFMQLAEREVDLGATSRVSIDAALEIPAARAPAAMAHATATVATKRVRNVVEVIRRGSVEATADGVGRSRRPVRRR